MFISKANIHAGRDRNGRFENHFKLFSVLIVQY